MDPYAGRYGTNITWKGEQISTYEANDSSKLSWTETTITFNNETIEA